MCMLKSATLATVLLMLLLNPVPSNGSRYASQMYYEISKFNDLDNIVVSPVTTFVTVGMLLFGLLGEAQKEIEAVLDGVAHGNIFIKSINMANTLFADKQITFNPLYSSILRDHLGSAPVSIDFNDQAKAIETINDYVRKDTKSKIGKYIENLTLANLTELTITNAASFRSNWADDIFRATSGLKPFFNGKERIMVNAMEASFFARYDNLPELNATAIEIPFANDNLRMLVILPNRNTTEDLKALTTKLSKYDLTKLPTNFTKKFVHLQLPTFRIHFSVPLDTVLRPMGVNKIFERPNFRPMTLNKNPYLKFVGLSHRCAIEVTEEAVEASAVVNGDLYQVAKQRSAISPPINFQVDHPFIFAIMDPNHAYFVGRVVDPKTT